MGLLSGGNSRTTNEFYDQSDNSVNYDLDEREYEAGESLYEIGGIGNELTVTDGGAFALVNNLVGSVERIFQTAVGFTDAQNDEVLTFAGDVYTESSNLAGQATVGANYSTAAVSKNLIYVAGAAALLFVATKVFK